jgi:hypothetical protein
MDSFEDHLDSQGLGLFGFQGKGPVEEKDRPLESFLNTAFRLGNCLQGKTPELSLGREVQGDFETLHFVVQSKVLHFGNGSAGTEAPVIDFQSRKKVVSLRVVSREKGEVYLDPEPHTDLRRSPVGDLVPHLHAGLFSVEEESFERIDGDSPLPFPKTPLP